MSHIVDFYRGISPDSQSRSIEDYHNQEHRWLESRHDFIQWLFPLPESSKYNSDAPTLTPEDIKVFKADKAVRAEVLRSVSLMLDFYMADPQWIGPRNHNNMRITRILRFLALIGEDGVARGFKRTIEGLIQFAGKKSTADTQDWWNDACNRNSSRFGRNLLR